MKMRHLLPLFLGPAFVLVCGGLTNSPAVGVAVGVVVLILSLAISRGDQLSGSDEDE